MGPQRPGQDEIFNAAAEIVDPTQRSAYLDEVCGDDAGLRAEIEDLLERDLAEASFLESPPPGLEDTLLHAPSEQPGDTVGPYKLLQEIGEGGFGVVYMAEQEQPVRRRVALKLIKPGMDTREVIARFEAERQALALMEHPHIARVLDAGATDSSRPYFVMELVKGAPITEYCDQNNLSAPRRLELFMTVCRAVQHAHQKGIIHRDIKPSNVLVTLHDSEPVVKVIDFGVAKAINQQLTEKTVFTNFGQMIGTPMYMSPEQAEMSGLDVDTRTDIYSLGVLLYELLTGSTPFDLQRLREAGYDELRRIIREEEPPKPSLRLSTLEDTLPSIAAQRHTEPKKLSLLVRGDLDWIVMKSLEKDRTRRYETANDLAREIERFLNDEAVEACPPSASYRLGKFARRNKVAIATVSLIAAVLFLGLAGTTWQAIRATREQELAQFERQRAETEAQEAELARQRESQERQRAEAEAHAAELARQRESVERLRADENFQRARQAVDDYFTAISENELLDEAGMESLRRELLEGALEYYLGFAEQQTDDPAVLGELAAAHSRIAQIYAATGSSDWPDAYSKCLDIVERLHREDADPAQWAGKLAGVFSYRGVDGPRTNRPLQALDVYQRGVVLYGKLVEAHPRVVAFQEELAVNHLVSAVIQVAIGQPQQAIPNLQHASGIWKKLMDDDPEQPLHALHFGEVYHNLARALSAAGRGQEAEATYRDTIQLLRDASGNEIQEYVTNALRLLAMRLRNQGRHDEAETLYREALSIQGRLLEEEQKTPRSRPGLRWQYGSTHDGFATLLKTTGRQAEAEQHIRQARNIFRELVAQNPATELYHGSLGRTCRQLGDLLSNTGRLVEAETSYREAMEIYIGLISQFPHNREYQLSRGYMLWSLAAVHDKTKRYADAEEEYRQAVEVFVQAAAEFPDWPFPRFEAGFTHWELGWMFERNERFAEAEQPFREALAVYEALSAESPNNKEYRNRLARSYRMLGENLLRQGKSAQRPDEAEPHLREALEIYNELISQAPGNRGYRTQAGNIHLTLAAAYTNANRLPEAGESYRTAAALLGRDAKNPNQQNKLAWRLVKHPYAEHPNRQTEAVQAVVELAKKAVESKPDAAHFWNTLGVAHYRAGVFPAAVEALNESVHRSSGNFSLNAFFLAMAHWRLGHSDAAHEWLEHAQRRMQSRAPDNRELIRFRAEAEGLLGRREGPVEARRPSDDDDLRLFTLVIQTRSETAWAYLERGKVHRNRGESEQAESDFRQALQLSTRALQEQATPQARAFRAGAHAELRQWEAAAADFLPATEGSNNVIHWYWRALTQLGAGNEADYRSTCAQMLERFGDTGDANVAQWVAWTCGLAPDAVANLAPAAELAQQAVGAHANDAFYVVTLGAVLYRAGRFDEAAEQLARLSHTWDETGKTPTRSSPAYAWYLLAMTQQRLGRHDEAQQTLERAVRRHEQEIAQDEDPTAGIAWNRRLTLRLLRQESESTIGAPQDSNREVTHSE